MTIGVFLLAAWMVAYGLFAVGLVLRAWWLLAEAWSER